MGAIALPPASRWTQAAWDVDPQNSSGLASDANSGLPGHPVLTWNGGVVDKWGTTSPTLAQSTTIRFLYGHTDDSDPVVFTPLITDGAVVVMEGLFTAANLFASGVLGVVTARNRAFGVAQALQAVMPAGNFYGTILVNTTRSTTSTFIRNTAGVTWLLAQPLTEQALPVATLLYAEDVTTATGDSFAAYVPTAINFVRVHPIVSTLNTPETNPLYLYRLSSFDPSGTPGTNVFAFAGDCYFIDFVHNRRPQANVDGVALVQRFVNNYFPVGIMTDLRIPATISPNAQHSFQGGCIGGPICVSSGLYDCCLLMDVALAAHSGVLDVVSMQYGAIYLDTALTVNLATGRHEPKSGGFTNQWWGPGTLNVDGNSLLYYPAGAGMAAATFTQTGWELNKSANGWTSDATSFYTLGLTSAALDSPAGAGGFGGCAFNQGGATVSNGSFPTLPGTAGAASCIAVSPGTAATTTSTTQMPAGAVVVDCRLAVSTPYSGGATIEVGIAGTPAAYMGTADNDAQLDGTYDVPQQTAVAGLSAVVVTVGGAPGAGVCQVLVFYVVPVT